MRRPRAHHASPRLTINSERTGRAHVLQPVGHLIQGTVRQFEAELRRVEATDAPEIRVDLSRVESIDSDGVKLFINASARSRARCGRLLLVHRSAAVHRAFYTTGLESRLPFTDVD